MSQNPDFVKVNHDTDACIRASASGAPHPGYAPSSQHRRVLVALLVLLPCGLCSAFAEQRIELVKDLATNGIAGSSYPWGFFTAGEFTYFFAQRFDLGQELWRTDGTAQGTLFLKDINPGPGWCFPNYTMERFTPFVAAGRYVYFVADDGSRGDELWRSDGTGEGTQIVADINVGAGNGMSWGSSMCAFGDELLFIANDGVHGSELWRTNGESDETYLVADIVPGTASGGARELVSTGSQVFFTANDGIVGRELWVTDGSRDGTRLVKDLNKSEFNLLTISLAPLRNFCR